MDRQVLDALKKIESRLARIERELREGLVDRPKAGGAGEKRKVVTVVEVLR